METASTSSVSETSVMLLRHTVATVAYRGGKALRGAPESFADFKISESCRTPLQILAHIGDLFDWALHLAKGHHEWHSSEPLPWNEEVLRFFRTLQAFDDYLGSGAALECPIEKLFQGPIADSLTHAGQIAMLRRMAGSPMKAENYFRAEIMVGRVGADQAEPVREF